MHSVQSVSKKSNLSRRQRRRHRYSKASAAAASFLLSASFGPQVGGYRVAKAYRNTVPIVHGIVVSNISLALLQKEYIEQFYFEKRIGGGGPDPDVYADSYRHLNENTQPHSHFAKPLETGFHKSYIQLQLLRFG